MQPDLYNYIESTFTKDRIVDLANQFSKYGFIKIRDIVSNKLREEIKEEVLRLLEYNAERRDLLLATTGNTPRYMSIVKSEVIATESTLIPQIARSSSILELLGKIAREDIYTEVSADEEYLIARQDKVGDTHGWHWGDYSFALIWILETPPTEIGGMLQCVPHTSWNKDNPRIYEILCENQINTYELKSGDVYFLKTDITLHRTVPLRKDATRIMLNMTWSSKKDIERGLIGDDRWWDNPEVSAAIDS